MPKISEVTVPSINLLREKIETKIKGYSSLQMAAQACVDILYEEFQDLCVLVRLFATIPFGQLPATDQQFVKNLVPPNINPNLINDQMLVLSLLGTRGEKSAWNQRTTSQNHLGIPLVSGDFIEAIPMMSRLLKELGLGLDWINRKDTNIVAKTMGSLSGVFYVPEAATAVDQAGRKIITAQDFVSRHGIKTVFGVGGSYITGNTFATIIFFTRERLTKSQAELFMPVVNSLKIGTMSLVANHQLFS